jgi:hypothetical protein
MFMQVADAGLGERMSYPERIDLRMLFRVKAAARGTESCFVNMMVPNKRTGNQGTVIIAEKENLNVSKCRFAKCASVQQQRMMNQRDVVECVLNNLANSEARTGEDDR